MLVGFDTEYTFGTVRDIHGRPHGDVTTMRPVCACLAFADGRVLRLTDRFERLQELFDDPRYTFVVHGSHAESLFCERAGLRFPQRFIDTQLMSVLVLHALAYRLGSRVYQQASLANMTTRYGIAFPWGDDKDPIRDSIMRGTHLEDYSIDQVLDYCLADARACLQLYPPLHADMLQRCGPHVEQNLNNLYQPYALAMAAAARKGLRFDDQAWDRLLSLAPRYRQQLLMVMGNHGYDHDGEGIGDSAFRRMIGNLGMERDWPRTEKGKLSTKTDDLKAFSHQHEAIDAAYRLQRFSDFMNQDFGSRVDRDGRLRCGILPFAQHSSRNSTSSPNLMGMPGNMRPLLLPDEGCKFIHFDFSQQEPGVAGYLSGDEALMHDFATGDVYLNLGARMDLIKPGMSAAEAKRIRKTILKSLMLAILYGKSALSIARDIRCPYREALIHLHNFNHTYARLFAWLKNYVAVGMERGWAENVIGFRAAFNAISSKERGHVARACQNFPVQSSAAACFQLTGVYLADFGADIRLPIHDAYLLNVPDDPQAIAEVKSWVDAATTTATNQLFPGLAVKCDIEELHRFAKDGEEDSFDKWVAALEGELCLSAP
jgi:DNA polymerase-1